MFARHFMDSLEFARNGRELRGELAVAEMPRLQDKLFGPDGKIGFCIRGYQDKSGEPMLEVAMDGSCQLVCQRCLGGFAYPVQLVSRLLLVHEGEPDELSAEEDGPDSIPADKHLDVFAMLEEELLLSLPFAPMHPPGVCQLAARDLSQPENGAFAVLAGLKDK
ncbi:MAG: DUF177 domain-containing protein [Nitrosomonadales bacterium]|nr:DUF177 domain-containing protein [Nitrosomonadales bacterium]